jgi:hypothetical protein
VGFIDECGADRFAATLRPGSFGVIELWIEGCLMVEVLTADMQGEYLETVSVAGWRKILDDFALSEAA